MCPCPFFLGCFYGLGLIPMKSTLNTAGYTDILDKSALLTSWQQFVFVPVLFQHDISPKHKDSSIKKCFPSFLWKNVASL